VVLLPGYERMFDDSLSRKQLRHYRRQWLQRNRGVLRLSVEDMARKLGVTATEYRQFEEGLTEEVGGLSFEEVHYFIVQHQYALGVQGTQRIRIDSFER